MQKKIYINNSTKFIVHLSLFLIIFCSNDIIAQNFYRFSNPEANELTINPAFTGYGKGILIKAINRQQWLNIDGAPKTTFFSYDSPIFDNSGWSLMMIKESIGIKRDFGFYGSFAHHLRYRFMNISLGFQAGFLTKNILFSDLILLSDTDPAFNAGADVNLSVFNLGFGILLHSEYFHLGLSIPRLLGNEYPGIGDNGIYALYMKTLHYHLTIGGKIKFKDKISVNPTLVYRKIQGTPKHWTFLTSVHFKSGYNFGAGIHSFDAFIINTGFTFKEVFKINGAMDIAFSRINPNSTPLSFELVMSYLIISKRERFISPRYF